MKRVGIIGGVGPEASNKFCELLIRHTLAKKDQDNIPFLHFCNPQIPDRTDFIVGDGQNPVEELVKTSLVLQNAGADFLVIPCNTAHYFLSQIQERISVPIIDMTKVLVKSVLSEDRTINKIGILATTGSIRAGIYQNYFKSVGIEVVLLNEDDQQKLVMDAIYGNWGIKAGKKIRPKRLLQKATENLISRGAEAVILGCTEVPLVLKQGDFDVKLYDPMDLTAKEIAKYIKEDADNEIIDVRFVLEDFARSIGRIFSCEDKDIGVEIVVE